jgi:hypothetical protein
MPDVSVQLLPAPSDMKHTCAHPLYAYICTLLFPPCGLCHAPQLLSLAEQQGGLTTLLANWTSATIHQLAPMFVMDHAVAM